MHSISVYAVVLMCVPCDSKTERCRQAPNNSIIPQHPQKKAVCGRLSISFSVTPLCKSVKLKELASVCRLRLKLFIRDTKDTVQNQKKRNAFLV